jgi:hypothetical protein
MPAIQKTGKSALPNAVCFLALSIACLVASCATKQSETTTSDATPAEPGSGIVEYRQLTKESLVALHVVLDSLNKFEAQPNPCPPKVIETFADHVNRLQVDSLRIRARAQVIQARGDAYFASWSESLARIKKPEVRAAAEHFRPEFEQSFSRIKLASKEAGSEFNPFLHGLRMLRIDLEKDPDCMKENAAKELVRTTREHGKEVIRQLNAVNTELESITKMLTPGKAVTTSGAS